MRARRATLALLALPLIVALPACGDVERTFANKSVATPAEVENPTPTVFPAPTEEPEPTEPAGSASPTTSAPPVSGTDGSTVIATADNKFDPATITVRNGTTVTWESQGFHTVTGGETTRDPDSPLNSGFLQSGQTYEFTFDQPGTYKYFCEPHVSLGMVGEVIVQ